VYSVVVTSHGLVMVFGFIMPVVLGSLGNYFVPVFLCCCDLVLPRLNCVSLWFYVCGVSLVVCSSCIDEGIGVG